MINLQPIEPGERIPRHEHRVRDFSRDYALIIELGDRYVTDDAGAMDVIRRVAGRFGVPVPDVAFNRRRRHDTGQCWAPRWHAVLTNGEDRIVAWETYHHRAYPENGRIRLGRTTTLRTIAHELGHHLVHNLDPVRTPGHGKVWVGRLDDAMETIADEVRVWGGPSDTVSIR